MADDTELHFNELSMGDAAKQLIRSITFDVGFMNRWLGYTQAISS